VCACVRARVRVVLTLFITTKWSDPLVKDMIVGFVLVSLPPLTVFGKPCNYVGQPLIW